MSTRSYPAWPSGILVSPYSLEAHNSPRSETIPLRTGPCGSKCAKLLERFTRSSIVMSRPSPFNCVRSSSSIVSCSTTTVPNMLQERGILQHDCVSSLSKAFNYFVLCYKLKIAGLEIYGGIEIFSERDGSCKSWRPHQRKRGCYC